MRVLEKILQHVQNAELVVFSHQVKNVSFVVVNCQIPQNGNSDEQRAK